MKKLLKILKYIGISILSIILIVSIIGYIISEDLPEGKKGKEADLLAEKILEELNYEAYQNTSFIGWTFGGMHSYQWHKDKNYVIVSTDKYEVKIDLDNYKYSEVLSCSNSTDPEKLIQTSIKNFNNDSFWLVAPYKIMENNVERRLVTENNEERLLVTYTSGGSTPGDSYLWKVDENNKPTSFKMWVSIIPIGGLEAKWLGWTKTESGSILSTQKTVFGIPIEITNLKTKS